MEQGQLQTARSRGLHFGECTGKDHVIAQVDVVEHRSVALEVTELIAGLHLKGNLNLA